MRWNGMAFVTVHLHPSSPAIYTVNLRVHIHLHIHPHIHVHYIPCRDNSHPLQAIFIPFRDYYPLSIHQGYLAYIRIFTQKK